MGGKRGDKWGQHGGRYGGQDSRHWSSRQDAWWHKEKDTHDAHKFPSYDVEWQTKDIEAVSETRNPGDASKPMTFTKQVQAAVNVARKHDIRVAKLTSDQAVKERRWKAYTTKMQQAFMQEHARHRANLAQLKKELSEALAAQQAAQQQLRAVFAVAPSEPQAEQFPAMNEWAAMMAGQMDIDTDDDLQEEDAMRYAQRFMASTVGAPEGGPAGSPQFGFANTALEATTPPRRSHAGPPMTPPAASYAPSTDRPPRPVDPYMVSPGTAAMAAASLQAGDGDHHNAPTPEHFCHGTAGTISKQPPKTAGPKGRSPVKELHKVPTMPLQGVGLASKLEIRRALRPFGGAPSNAANGNGAGLLADPGPVTSNLGPIFHALEESEDNGEPPPQTDVPGTASPGFGNLE